MTYLNSHVREDMNVFIGRLEPPHRGHEAVITEALATSSHTALLLGSAFEPRTYRNPFYETERAEMVRAVFGQDPRLHILNLEDSSYNLNEWIERVHNLVDGRLEALSGPDHESKVSLIGFSKDASSFYLDLFPTWGSRNVVQKHILDATSIRASLFGDLPMVEAYLDADGSENPTSIYLKHYADVALARANTFLASEMIKGESNQGDLSLPVSEWLMNFVNTSDKFRQVTDEFAFVAKYQNQWKHAPYPPKHVTVDLCIVKAGHVLVIERKGFPGKGLLAMPGGHLDEWEEIIDGCVREAREETGLRVPTSVLLGSSVEKDASGAARTVYFDSPHRSSRGRTITHVLFVHLPPGGPLPKVKPRSDAKRADWMKLSDMNRREFFEDHYAIIKSLVARI